jgi:hypothetical protein
MAITSVSKKARRFRALSIVLFALAIFFGLGTIALAGFNIRISPFLTGLVFVCTTAAGWGFRHRAKDVGLTDHEVSSGDSP